MRSERSDRRRLRSVHQLQLHGARQPRQAKQQLPQQQLLLLLLLRRPQWVQQRQLQSALRVHQRAGKQRRRVASQPQHRRQPLQPLTIRPKRTI